MAENFPSPIETIVATMGLPSDVWLAIPPHPLDTGRNVHELVSSAFRDNGKSIDSLYCKQIWVHDRTIRALEALPAAHVIGQSVLVRIGAHFTAMVSIAEAASVLLGKGLSDLLWILVEFIAQELRAESANTSRRCSSIAWKKEISSAEHFDNKSRERNQMERNQERQQIAEIREEQPELRHKLDELHSKTERIL